MTIVLFTDEAFLDIMEFGTYTLQCSQRSPGSPKIWAALL